MFDVLVFVFENYLPGACPEPSALARKLTAVGFDRDDIDEALSWLDGLDRSQDDAVAIVAPSANALRGYHPTELAKLPTDCRALLAFLEEAGAIDAVSREMILERAMAVAAPVVPLEKFKVIVLMVVWRRQLSLDTLIFEELLAEDDDPQTLH